MKNYLLTGISCLVLFISCKETAKAYQPKYNVSVLRDTSLNYSTYAIVDSMESMSLRVHQSELNKGVIQYLYKGESPLDKQIPKLDTLFSALFNDTRIDFDIKTLSWGRLEDSFKHDFTLSKRLALFAKHSDNWDVKSGKPVSGFANNFVKNLKDDFSIELAPLLKKYNYEIISISVEKVLVNEAGKLEFWDEIKSQVAANDKLPFDCQLWFILHKIK